LAAELGADPAVVFAFVSPDYDLDALGPALEHAFPHGVVGACTTAGQIGPAGFQPDGISSRGSRICSSTPPTTGRVVLSGHTEQGVARRATPLAHEFLSKPFDADVSMFAIERA